MLTRDFLFLALYSFLFFQNQITHNKIIKENLNLYGHYNSNSTSTEVTEALQPNKLQDRCNFYDYVLRNTILSLKLEYTCHMHQGGHVCNSFLDLRDFVSISTNG